MAFDRRARRQKIRFRVRNKIKGTSSRPRLSVFKSNKSIYAQLIDDVSGHTLASASSIEASVNSGSKLEASKAVGSLIAERAKAANLEDVVFDRNGYVYHGRVKALAEAAREGGLKF